MIQRSRSVQQGSAVEQSTLAMPSRMALAKAAWASLALILLSGCASADNGPTLPDLPFHYSTPWDGPQPPPVPKSPISASGGARTFRAATVDLGIR